MLEKYDKMLATLMGHLPRAQDEGDADRVPELAPFDMLMLDEYRSVSSGLPSIDAARVAATSERSANYDEVFRRLYHQEPPKWQ